ncbi:hypothetical protein OJ253_1784 [Cryptosporidium canis]|uniref:RRM domain-containing protein n=1 Tax=Cryptosporidium canis TaxID=195482 RepID=A0A9D5DIM6_9CRYT|nr:hypothetical protein OJ253_1784 [Cryptosporidium canis]
MHSLWSNPNVINQHCQLLFIECELWRLYPGEKHHVPIVNGNTGDNRPLLSHESSFIGSSSLYKYSDILNISDSKYLVEVSLLPIHSNQHDLKNSTGFTAFVSTNFLSTPSLSYSKDCTDVKGLSERIERQSILDLDRIYRLISYFLSCCQNKDCNCNLATSNNNSYILTWDPSKTKQLLNIDLFNEIANGNHPLAFNYSCQNSLRNKFNSIISLSGLIKSFLPEFWPAYEPSSSLELLSILKNIACSFHLSVDDIINSPDLNNNSASVGLPSLYCRYMAKISLKLIKLGLVVIRQERDAASDRKDLSQPTEFSQVRPVVRLRGLPWKTAILDIIAFFSPICKISASDIAISYNKDGRMTGEAYILLPSTRIYELSLTLLHGKRMGKRWIEVLPSSTQEFLICTQITSLRKQNPSHPSNADSSFERYCSRHILRLRGLPWSTTEQDIVNFFTSGGVHDVNVSDVFIGITNNQRASGEAWVILPHKCNAFEVQRVLNGRIIGKRYIEVFISSFKELTSTKSTYSLKHGYREITHVQSNTSTNHSTCSAASNGQATNGRAHASCRGNRYIRRG